VTGHVNEAMVGNLQERVTDPVSGKALALRKDAK